MMSGEHNQYQKTTGYEMNQRIKLLAEQCRLKSYGINGELLDVDFDEGKFAQLIVQECLAQADKIRDGCEVDDESQQALGADWAGLAIARHFGVDNERQN